MRRITKMDTAIDNVNIYFSGNQQIQIITTIKTYVILSCEYK